LHAKHSVFYLFIVNSAESISFRNIFRGNGCFSVGEFYGIRAIQLFLVEFLIEQSKKAMVHSFSKELLLLEMV
jgi:hypothetical protein